MACSCGHQGEFLSLPSEAYGDIGFEISIGGNQDIETCEETDTPLYVSESEDTQVRYTYRVFWTVGALFELLTLTNADIFPQESDTPWVSEIQGALTAGLNPPRGYALG